MKGAGLTEGTFAGAGGCEIFWRNWVPAAEPASVVVIAHGLSEHSGRYEHVAADLVAAGHAVYALDHRGHGRSGGPRALIDRVVHAVADLDQLIAMAHQENPRVPLTLLGHSMGGAISLAYAVRNEDHIDRLIVSAPAVSLEAAPPLTRLAARVLSVVAPRLGIYDVEASLICTDPAVVTDYEQDPLVFHKNVPARTVAEIIGESVKLPDRLPALRLPLLVLHGTDDGIIPMASSSGMVLERAGSESKRFKTYPGMYHEILNEPDRGKVLDDIRSWLDETKYLVAPQAQD